MTETRIPTSRFRWMIDYDGERVLQQLFTTSSAMSEWIAVPEVEHEEVKSVALNPLVETVAEVIDPESFSKYRKEHSKNKNVTLEKMSLIGPINEARERARKIISLMEGLSSGK